MPQEFFTNSDTLYSQFSDRVIGENKIESRSVLEHQRANMKERRVRENKVTMNSVFEMRE